MRILLLACVVAGCGNESKPSSDEEREVREVDVEIAKLPSQDVDKRAFGAMAVAVACCDFEADAWRPARALARPRACAALERVLLTERDPRVLEAPLRSFSLGTCDVTVPEAVILELCSEKHASKTRQSASRALAVIRPSPELTRAILGMSRGLERGDPWRESLVVPLGQFGELDLAPVVELMSDPDPRTRDIGVQTVSFALSSGPLDDPEILRALDRLSKQDSDKELASYADDIAREYRSKLEPPDLTVARYVSDGNVTLDEIRMLAVRRGFCTSRNAQVVLERIVHGDKPDLMVAAKRALAMRAKRCGK